MQKKASSDNEYRLFKHRDTRGDDRILPTKPSVDTDRYESIPRGEAGRFAARKKITPERANRLGGWDDVTRLSLLQDGNIRNLQEQLTQLAQQRQTVHSNLLIFRHDHHLIEERIDGLTQ
ncbi:hypothetical protein PEC331060_28370 [Pectobacterium carotovorum subsp. carotovorum]|nr:hypothetical protein PEC331060_28370 [Pectobacterium carotovorum subsp. carotovorum]